MKRFGLLGSNLSHSFSPQVHSMLTHNAYEYKLYPMPPESVETFIKNYDFDGINITIPYKKTIIPYCCELSDEAELIGSVNTVTVCADGTLKGYNTDYEGFSSLLDGFNVNGGKVIVLGSGGAAMTAVKVLEAYNASQIKVISRTGIDNYSNISRYYDCDLIVNATPVGMYPNNGTALLELEKFKKCSGVIDMVYNPLKTKLLLDAEKFGIPCVNGLKMLITQAAAACKIFTGTEPAESVESVLHLIRRQMTNIVLIGMAGCGKTTQGRRIAESLKRPFYDTDEILEINTGKTISEIFQNEGEASFRSYECIAIAEAGKHLGAVIATGGGAVLNPSNIESLRQNGKITFINPPIKTLATDGRPLYTNEEAVKKIYEERLPLYRKYSDYEVENSETISY